jgi:hypothetical protein
MHNEYVNRYKSGTSGIISFYKEQLRRFNKIGIGNKTEFNTIVTETLIEATERRLRELQLKKWRRKGLNNGSI